MKQVSDQVFSEADFSDKQAMMDHRHILNSSLTLDVDHEGATWDSKLVQLWAKNVAPTESTVVHLRF